MLVVGSLAVVEMFTSQGCSSCPPADQIIGELAKDPNVIALSMPIEYWDYLGWKDTLADSRFSARQKAYSHMRGDRDVYTPQVIVNGATHVIGSDRARIEGAIKDTGKTDKVMSLPVTMTLSGKQLTVSVAAAKSEAVASNNVEAFGRRKRFFIACLLGCSVFASCDTLVISVLQMYILTRTTCQEEFEQEAS